MIKLFLHKCKRELRYSGVGVLKSGVGEIQCYVYILHSIHRGVLRATESGFEYVSDFKGRKVLRKRNRLSRLSLKVL